MKILCVGGGPAGLYFSILMKRQDPTHEITVIERNRPADTFGFGVVFSERTLSYLQNQDGVVSREITRSSPTWDPIEVHFPGKNLFCYGNGFSAIARKRLLTILQRARGHLPRRLSPRMPPLPHQHRRAVLEDGHDEGRRGGPEPAVLVPAAAGHLDVVDH